MKRNNSIWTKCLYERYLLAEILLASLVFFVPLSAGISELLGVSLYPFLILLVLAVVAGNVYLHNKRVKNYPIEFGNVLFLFFALTLAAKITSFTIAVKIMGAIFIPYILGSIYAFQGEKVTKFGNFIFVFLLIKIMLLTVFFNEYLKEYPVRPEVGGKAIYLLFGWGLDVAPFLFIYFLYKRLRPTISKITLLFIILCVTSLVIVGIGSRTLMLSSVVFSVLFSYIFMKNTVMRYIGMLVFPTLIMASLAIMPMKAQHLQAMFNTVYIQLTSDNFNHDSFLDKSTNMRIDGAISSFVSDENTWSGHELSSDVSKFNWAGHNWFSQALYYLGYSGFTIFVLIAILSITKLFGYFSKYRERIRSNEMAIYALTFSYFLHIFYTNGFLNDPIFFVLLGLLFNRKEGGINIDNTLLTWRRPHSHVKIID